MNALEAALKQGQWERAALYLLLGMLRAAEKLPQETLTALLEVLGGDFNSKRSFEP